MNTQLHLVILSAWNRAGHRLGAQQTPVEYSVAIFLARFVLETPAWLSNGRETKARCLCPPWDPGTASGSRFPVSPGVESTAVLRGLDPDGGKPWGWSVRPQWDSSLKTWRMPCLSFVMESLWCTPSFFRWRAWDAEQFSVLSKVTANYQPESTKYPDIYKR